MENSKFFLRVGHAITDVAYRAKTANQKLKYRCNLLFFPYIEEEFGKMHWEMDILVWPRLLMISSLYTAASGANQPGKYIRSMITTLPSSYESVIGISSLRNNNSSYDLPPDSRLVQQVLREIYG